MEKLIRKFFSVMASFSMLLSMTNVSAPVFAEEAPIESKVELKVSTYGLGSVDVKVEEDIFTIPSNDEHSFELAKGQKVSFKAYTEGSIDDISLNEKTITEYEQNKSTLEFEREINEKTSVKVAFYNIPQDAQLEESEAEEVKEQVEESGETDTEESKESSEEKEESVEEEEEIKTNNESGGVTVMAHNYYTAHFPSGGSLGVGVWTLSNGAAAICGNATYAGPEDGVSAGTFVLTNSNARKALYYGFNGPENKLADLPGEMQLSITTELVQHAVCGQSVLEYLGYMEQQYTVGKYAYIYDLPDPGNNYTAYGVRYSQAGSAVSTVTGTVQPYQDLYYGVYNPVTYVYFTLKKASANTSITQGNSCYSLSGAVYSVYSDKTCKDLIDKITIKADGTGDKVLKLESDIGHVYVKETKAPKGYELDTKVYDFRPAGASESAPTVGNVTDNPGGDPLAIILKKKSDDQNGKPLKGAQFTVKYYSDYYASETELSDVKPTRTWVFETDEDGFIYLSNDWLVADKSDDLYYDVTNNETIPHGTITIQETKAPDGYALQKGLLTLGNGKKVFQFGKEDSSAVFGENASTYTDKKIVIHTTAENTNGTKLVNVGKNETIVDHVSYENLTPGKEYTLTGTIMDKSTGKPLEVNGTKITATKKFTPEKANGTVDIEFTFVIPQNVPQMVVFEDIKRGDIEHASHADINDTDQTVQVPSLATTARSDNGTQDAPVVNKEITIFDDVKYTNLIVGKEYEIKGTLMDQDTGKPLLVNGKEVTVTKKFTPTKASGTETVEFKLNSKDLEGKTTVVFEDLYSEGKKVVFHNDLTDKVQTVRFVNLKTTALSVDNMDELQALDKNTTIKDIVKLSNLEAGVEYTVKGILMDKETGKALLADGKEITSSKKFTATEGDNRVEVTFTINGKDLAGKNTVVFETLFKGEVEVAEHKNISDESQTVHWINIQTTASTEEGKENHEAYVDKKVTIYDTVSYTNLKPGKEYTMKGVLMNKETGKALVDKEGKEITASQTFTPEKANGSVVVKFEFDASLASKEIVVFEDLIRENVTLATHADINDKDQSIEIQEPKVKTTARAEHGAKDAQVTDKIITISDAVEYSGLIAGKEYEIKGKLMDKDTGKALLVNGKEVTASKKFTATSASGVETLEFKLNTKDLEGKTTVVFEDLYYSEKKIATHSDLTDRDQTIHFVDLKTTALSADNIDDIQALDVETTVRDIVKLSNLEGEKKYKVSGTLMDKETGKPLLDKDGKEITSVKDFTAVEGENTVEVEFKVNGKDLAGKQTVVFEKLYKMEKEVYIMVAVHEDLDDEKQTIQWIDIRTTASTEEGKENHEDVVSKETTIYDTVKYTGLEVGKEYTVKGVLMNKETGKPLLDKDGKEITAETTFKAEKADGEVDVVFTFDSSIYGEITTVVFEDLYKDGIKVATHADIEDKPQTVVLKPQNVCINKVDQNGNFVEGAELQIWADGTVLDEWTTGKVVDGFDASRMTATDMKVNVFSNETGEITEVPLYKYSFEIHSNGVLTKAYTFVDGNGKEYIHHVNKYLYPKEKVYFLHEVSVPEEDENGIGYLPAEDVVITIPENGIQTVEMVDKKTDTVEVTKFDVTNKKELSGAKLVVKDSEGNVIDEWVSTKDPHAIKGLVVGGTYTLTETIAPKGYAISETVEFTVEDNGKVVQKVEMFDALLPKKKTTSTSVDTHAPFFMGMAMFSIIVMGIVYFVMKRKNF